MKNSTPENTKCGNAHTTAPVAASPTDNLNPEFADAAGIQRLFGIKRSLLYTLMAEGLIRGVSLRRRGQIRGKRLFDVDSVRAFLRSRMEAGD